MTTSDAGELLQRVRTLELVARKNVVGRLQGDYVSAIKGRGLLFEEPRRYVQGDPVRSIDWNITARVAETHVRVHREERRRDVMLVVDVSPSMHAGSQRRTKLETAVELAATLAVSAREAGDRLGYVLYADRVLAESRPRLGRAQLFRVLRALLEHSDSWTRRVTVSDPRVALHHLEARRGGPMVVFLISDFMDEDVPEDLRYLRPRHAVSLLHVFDPLERDEPRDMVVPAFDPEGIEPSAGGRIGRADSRPAPLSLSPLESAAAGLGIRYLPVSTADSVPAILAAHFLRKGPRRFS